MSNQTLSLAWLVTLTAVLVAGARAACADVTIEQQTTFDFSIIKAHGAQTEYTTSDKQRRDSDLHCEGFMSLMCGNAQSADIIRLDRDVQWVLEPKKKEYRETAFPTAAQRQAAEQQMQASLEKMKQCPATQQRSAPGPDTSTCEMSPARVEVKQPGTHATVAGHDTQLRQLALTQSCTNQSTGDVCDFVFALDSWLTQDPIAGLDDRRAFEMAYLKKLGLDASNPVTQQQMRQFLAPYADALKQLSSKAADFKGYPLKTVVRIAFGGEHCAAAKQSTPTSASSGNAVGDAGQAAGNAATSSAAGAAGSAAGTAATNAADGGAGGSILGSAASAFSSKLVSGLFAKKQPDPAPSASTPAAGPANGLAPGMIQAAQFTTETISISTAPVPAAQFDIPAGWRLIEPKAKTVQEFSCPKAGS
jgi:hypothetical protein